MAQVNHIQTNFTSGEVSPQMHGRVDIQRYHNGVAEMENFIVRPHGGVVFRPGTKYVTGVEGFSSSVLLEKFVFSIDDAYLLEFTPSLVKIFKNNVFETSVVTPYNTGPIIEALEFTQSADVLFISNPLFKTRTLSRTGTSWSLDIFEHRDGPYLDEDTGETTLWLEDITNRATITSTEDDFVVGDVGDFVEYMDEGFLVIGEIVAYISPTQVTIEPKTNVIADSSISPLSVISYHARVGGDPAEDPLWYRAKNAITGEFPDRLRSVSAIWGTESEYSFIKIEDVWYLTGRHGAATEEITVTGGPNYSTDVIEVTAIPTMVSTTGNLALSGQLITATLKASADTLVSARDVGRQFRLNFSTQQVWGTITSVTNAREAEVTLGRMVPLAPRDPTKYRNDAKTTKWRLGAWYTDNYPHKIIIHEQRLVFARTDSQPQTVWMSRPGVFSDFSPTENDSAVLDNNGIVFTLGSKQVNSIVWLETGPTFLIGTISGEWQLRASSIKEPLTPTNVSLSQQTTSGAPEYTAPQRIGSSVIFSHRTRRKLWEMIYNFQIDAFETKDLTIISEHIFRLGNGIHKTAYLVDPHSLLWVLLKDGTLAACTFEKDQEVIAWHPHHVGGFVEDIIAVPSGELTNLYMVVRRTVNGTTRRYIEVLSQVFEPSNDQDKDAMIFLDSHTTYDGSPTTTITGLSHLEGLEVGVVADGSEHDRLTVSSGQVQLTYEASVVHVGIPYVGKIQTLPPEGGSEYGTSQGVIKRIDKVILRLINSIGFKVGKDLSSLQAVSFRSSDGFMDVSPALRTGDIEIRPELSFDNRMQFYIVQDQPYPLNILSIVSQIKVNG